MHLGAWELIAIFAIVLLIVGGKRLPEIGKSIGQAIREFQRSVRGGSDDRHDKKDGKA